MFIYYIRYVAHSKILMIFFLHENNWNYHNWIIHLNDLNYEFDDFDDFFL